jgi:hypothetical protein
MTTRSAKIVSTRTTVGLLIVGGVALLLLASGCDWITTFSSLTRPPPSVQNPPSYPGAQFLEVKSNGTEDKIITFQTPDKVADVLRFYDKVLRDDGWYRCESNSDVGLSCLAVPNGVVYQWVQGSIDGPTNLGYRFTLVATDTGNVTGLTPVRIEIIRFNPTSINRYGTPYPAIPSVTKP